MNCTLINGEQDEYCYVCFTTVKKIFEGGAQQTPALDECAINLSAELESGVIGPDSVLALKKEGKLHSSDR